MTDDANHYVVWDGAGWRGLAVEDGRTQSEKDSGRCPCCQMPANMIPICKGCVDAFEYESGGSGRSLHMDQWRLRGERIRDMDRRSPRLWSEYYLSRQLFNSDRRVVDFITLVAEAPVSDTSPHAVSRRQVVQERAWERDEGGYRAEAVQLAKRVLDATQAPAKAKS